jgi:type IV secretion system protein VirB10
MIPVVVPEPEPEKDEPVPASGRRRGAKIIDMWTRDAVSPPRPRQRDERLGMYAGLAVIGVLVGLTVWTLNQSQQAPSRPAAERPEDRGVLPVSIPLSGPQGDWELAIAPPPPGEETPAAPLAAPALSPVLANPSGLPDVSEALPAPSAKPAAGPTVVYQSGSDDSGVGFAFQPGAGSDFGSAVKPDSSAAAGSAGNKVPPARFTGDAAKMLGKGTLIPAILETAIDSNVPGGVRAVVSTDVLSADGKRSLVPRSSRLIGQYKTRRSAGQNSAYVVWTQIVRPDGVRIEVPSSAAGAGERQFFERFGAAKLVSVVAGQAGADLRARQGEPVRIMAARDVDLSQTR